MDARIVTVCCLAFVAVCVSAHRPSGGSSESDSQERSSDGVCYYTRLEYTYEWVNQSYPCCKEKVRPHCRGTRFRRWSDFHLPDFGPVCHCTYLPRNPCIYVVATTCYRRVRECRARPVRKEYCCSGYRSDSRGKCVEDRDDFYECGTDNGGCEQICRCRDRRPECSCLPGFTLDGTRRCRDIDECAVNNGRCQHDCHNINGSYYCSCRAGFVLTTRYDCTEVAVSTPAVTPSPTVLQPTTTTEFREPLASTSIAPGAGSPGAGVGPAERIFADDGEEGGHGDSHVASIVSSLAGLLALVLLALLIWALVRCGYCLCCCCCAAAAVEKKAEPGQAYDNEVYEDLAACVSAGKEKPVIYDNVVVVADEETREKKSIDEQVYDNRLNHDLYAAGVASANPAVYDNAAVVDDTSQAGDKDTASQTNVYVDMQ